MLALFLNPQSCNSSLMSLLCERCNGGILRVKVPPSIRYQDTHTRAHTHRHTDKLPHVRTSLLPTYQESFWSCASREPGRVFGLKASQMGISVCVSKCVSPMFVCVIVLKKNRVRRFIHRDWQRKSLQIKKPNSVLLNFQRRESHTDLQMTILLKYKLTR